MTIVKTSEIIEWVKNAVEKKMIKPRMLMVIYRL